MATFEGIYPSLLDGVSQQTPQERREGQLGEQINMLSDKVTGLRRRSGVMFNQQWAVSPDCYFEIVYLGGDPYMVAIDPEVGKVSVKGFSNGNTLTRASDYFQAASKSAYRTVVSNDKLFILNTEKIPTKELQTGTVSNYPIDPQEMGYFSIRGGAFSKTYTIEVGHPLWGNLTFTVTTSDSTAAEASPEWIATQLANQLSANNTISANCYVAVSGVTIGLIMKEDSRGLGQLTVQSSTSVGGFVSVSGASRVTARSELLGQLPSAMNRYIMAVGNVGNSAYYRYDSVSKKWVECGVWEPPYKYTNMPRYVYLNDSDALAMQEISMTVRTAGDDDNNPFPSFLNYGITGIGAYQSRLVLLSGSYVCFSKTNTYDTFMRTTVTELLDDDPIEVASASLTSAQYEYCIPYNKDLVLIAQSQQAVIPANSTVLSPKNIVIYPSTEVELSLAVKPAIVGRTMYYAYQRGTDYYQVGEFIPNSYTDAQYYTQNLTDHLPLYYSGLCTTMVSSSTNNMVICASDENQVLVNQYMWVGDERKLMAFHKWIYPYKVRYAQFIQEYLVTFLDDGNGGTIIGTQNVQLNQLDDKPVPYLDMYSYLDIVDGSAELPEFYLGKEFVAVIYDSKELRHKEIQYTIRDGRIYCPYDGRIAIGYRYTSVFQLTPPFMRDDNDKVVAGARSTVQSLRMTFKNTSNFDITVRDTMGVSYEGDDTAAMTWSEARLGYTWVNSVGSVTIPCRTQLSSTECTVSTDSATDLNLISTEYVLRVATKRRRI